MNPIGKTQARLFQRQRATLIGVFVAAIMVPLDITIVGVALERIGQSLGASFAMLQWIINGYTVVFASFLLTGGSLADLYGRRRMLAFGLSLFTLSSLLCGFSQSSLMLDLFRALQGLGAAFLLPSCTAVLAHEFRGAERAKVFGLLGAAMGSGLALGPLVGGILVTWLGWRWIFWVNVPVGFGLLMLAVPKMSESSDPSATRVDWLGLVSVTLSLFLFTSALIEASELGWGSPRIIGALLGAGVSITFFIIVERWQHRSMFDLGLFGNPSFVAAQILPFAVSLIFVTLQVYLPLYFQGLKGYSPLQAGLVMQSVTVPIFIVPILVGRLAMRLPLRLILSVGFVLSGFGLLLLSRSEVGAGGTALLSELAVTGIGLGTTIGLLDNLAVSVVPSQRSGMAAGIFNTMRFGGDAIGIAGSGAILIALIQTQLLNLLSGTPAAVGTRVDELANSIARGNIDGAVASVPAAGREVFLQAATQSYTNALHVVFIILGCVSFASAVVALALVRARDVVREPTF